MRPEATSGKLAELEKRYQQTLNVREKALVQIE